MRLLSGLICQMVELVGKSPLLFLLLLSSLNSASEVEALILWSCCGGANPQATSH